MFYNSEIAFVVEFLANLKLLGVNEIPFDNAEFYDGIEQMDQYFQENRYDQKGAFDEIGMLFIKNPLERVYKRFRDVMSNENGDYLSFINPAYIKGVLDFSDEDAVYIIKKNRSGLEQSFISNCTSEFCKGAQIETVR